MTGQWTLDSSSIAKVIIANRHFSIVNYESDKGA